MSSPQRLDIGGGKPTPERPTPGGGKPKPQRQVCAPTLPKGRCLYPYDALNAEELSIAVGDIIEILKEGTLRSALPGVLILRHNTASYVANRRAKTQRTFFNVYNMCGRERTGLNA